MSLVDTGGSAAKAGSACAPAARAETAADVEPGTANSEPVVTGVPAASRFWKFMIG